MDDFYEFLEDVNNDFLNINKSSINELLTDNNIDEL